MTEATNYRISIKMIEKLEQSNTKNIEFQDSQLSTPTHGDILSIMAIVAPPAIAAIAAIWLKRHDYENFEEEIEIQQPDGTWIKRKIKYKKSKSENASAELIEAIKGA